MVFQDQEDCSEEVIQEDRLEDVLDVAATATDASYHICGTTTASFMQPNSMNQGESVTLSSSHDDDDDDEYAAASEDTTQMRLSLMGSSRTAPNCWLTAPRLRYPHI